MLSLPCCAFAAGALSFASDLAELGSLTRGFDVALFGRNGRARGTDWGTPAARYAYCVRKAQCRNVERLNINVAAATFAAPDTALASNQSVGSGPASRVPGHGDGHGLGVIRLTERPVGLPAGGNCCDIEVCWRRLLGLPNHRGGADDAVGRLRAKVAEENQMGQLCATPVIPPVGPIRTGDLGIFSF
jgi:hypothetical protein